MTYNVPLIAGESEQEREYYIRRINYYQPGRENDPALVYGNPRLEYIRLVNEGIINEASPVALPTTGGNLFESFAEMSISNGEMHPNAAVTYVASRNTSINIGGINRALIPYDPRRTYLVSFDVKADIPGTIMYFQLSWVDKGRVNLPTLPYVFNRKIVPTSWETWTVLVGPNTTVVPPMETAYVRPVIYLNHSQGTQGGNQYYANFRLIDVTDLDVSLGYRTFVDVHKQVTQASIPAGTITKVTFETEIDDVLNEFATSTFTAKTAGIYDITCNVAFPTAVANNNLMIYLYKNGAQHVILDRNTSAGTDATSLSGATQVKLAVGDTLDVYARTTIAVGITAGRVSTSLQIYRKA